MNQLIVSCTDDNKCEMCSDSKRSSIFAEVSLSTLVPLFHSYSQLNSKFNIYVKDKSSKNEIVRAGPGHIDPEA